MGIFHRNIPLLKLSYHEPSEIGRKIKELRLQSGLSQDELAELSQLSPRTIQRIENGETEPRGDSLKRISKAFNINVSELTTESSGETTDTILKKDKSILILINLAAFGFLIYPFLGIVFPMVLYIYYKDKVANVDKAGKAIMKRQIALCMVLSLTGVYVFIVKNYHLNFPLIPVGFAIAFIVILYILNAFSIVLNIFKLSSFQSKHIETQHNLYS